MTAKKILITGGAGFVGSHTADELVRQGHRVAVFDNLSQQVHPAGVPQYLSPEVEFIHGDVRDLPALTRALRGVDIVYHLAAAVGVGQSMYQIASYMAVNTLGTANLLQAILDTGVRIEKLIVASSMSIYGEGQYLCAECGSVSPGPRSAAQLHARDWEVHCPRCHRALAPIATDERKPLQCTSIYALSKKDQEEMALLFGRTYGLATVALRYFNIFGTRQALSNPYTGVIAIFGSRLLNRNAPVIFEDGLQLRDFVSVHDIVQANVLAMERSFADGMALNIGSGEAVSIRDIARELSAALGVQAPIQIMSKYRAGDIRHCFASIGAASEHLGYTPRVKLSDGLRELAPWLRQQQAKDRVDEAMERLAAHGLVA